MGAEPDPQPMRTAPALKGPSGIRSVPGTVSGGRGLLPHRIRAFGIPEGPRHAIGIHDAIGLYVGLPDQAAGWTVPVNPVHATPLSLKREVQGSHRIADVRMPETQRNQNIHIAINANISGRPQHTAVLLTKMGER